MTTLTELRNNLARDIYVRDVTNENVVLEHDLEEIVSEAFKAADIFVTHMEWKGEYTTPQACSCEAQESDAERDLRAALQRVLTERYHSAG